MATTISLIGIMDALPENEISYLIRKAIFKVYNNFGPGLLESAYEALLCHELKKLGLDVKRQVPVPLIYEDVNLDVGYRLDILVNDLVIVEIKAVEELHPKHGMQLVTYLKLTGKRLGILVNFNTDNISKSIFRKINGLKQTEN